MADGSAVVAGWAEAIVSFGNDWPTSGAEVCADMVRQQVALDTGGDSRLSNHVGGGVDVVIESGDGEADVRAAGSLGEWAILENGTDAHVILPRAGRYLLTPMGPRRMVHVQGVAARETWTQGVDSGIVEAQRDAEQAWQAVSD